MPRTTLSSATRSGCPPISPGASYYCWIVRLPGYSWTDRSLPFGIGRADGHTEVVLISAARGGLLSCCSPANLADIPEPVSSFLEAILADPPRVHVVNHV